MLGNSRCRRATRYGTAMADPWNYAGPVTQLGAGRRGGHPGRRVDLRHQWRGRRHRRRRGPGALLPRHPHPVPLRGPAQREPGRAPVRSDRRPLQRHLRGPEPARPGPGRLHRDGVPRAPRGPGHARGADPAQLRRRGHRVHGRRARRRRLRRPVRRQGGTGRPRRRPRDGHQRVEDGPTRRAHRRDDAGGATTALSTPTAAGRWPGGSRSGRRGGPGGRRVWSTTRWSCRRAASGRPASRSAR